MQQVKNREVVHREDSRRKEKEQFYAYIGIIHAIEMAKLNLNKSFLAFGNRKGWREAVGQPDTGVTSMNRHPALVEDNTVETPGTDQHLNGHCSSLCFPTHWGTQAATHSKDFQPQFE